MRGRGDLGVVRGREIGEGGVREVGGGNYVGGVGDRRRKGIGTGGRKGGVKEGTKKWEVGRRDGGSLGKGQREGTKDWWGEG